MTESATREDTLRDAFLRLTLANVQRELSKGEEQLVRQLVAHQIETTRRLRDVPLQNSDEPEHGFDPALPRSVASGESH